MLTQRKPAEKPARADPVQVTMNFNTTVEVKPASMPEA